MWPFYISRGGMHGTRKVWRSISHMHGIHSLAVSRPFMMHEKMSGGLWLNALTQEAKSSNLEKKQTKQFPEIKLKIYLFFASGCSSLTYLNCYNCFSVGNYVRLPKLQVKQFRSLIWSLITNNFLTTQQCSELLRYFELQELHQILHYFGIYAKIGVGNFIFRILRGWLSKWCGDIVPGCIAVEMKSQTDVKCYKEQWLKHQPNLTWQIQMFWHFVLLILFPNKHEF